ncbi:MAG: hypothetical protein H8E98_05175 [Bacteroidetes bacterium]|nr:hypothetical protein [Bacteroidota bacterium]
MNITIKVPDRLGESYNQLPNRTSVEEEIVTMLAKYIDSIQEKSTATKKKGKWAKVVDELKQEKLLYGLSDEVTKASQEIRENFAFNNDE